MNRGKRRSLEIESIVPLKTIFRLDYFKITSTVPLKTIFRLDYFKITSTVPLKTIFRLDYFKIMIENHFQPNQQSQV